MRDVVSELEKLERSSEVKKLGAENSIAHAAALIIDVLEELESGEDV